MMRLVTPKGELREVMQNVFCIKEKTVSFAEKTKRVVVRAEQMDAEVNGFIIGMGFDKMVFGNLTSDKVSEILTEMAEKGYYNFLGKGFEVIDSPKKIPALHGRPYYLTEIPEHWNQPGMCLRCGMDFPQGNGFDEEDDLFLNEDDEI